MFYRDYNFDFNILDYDFNFNLQTLYYILVYYNIIDLSVEFDHKPCYDFVQNRNLFHALFSILYDVTRAAIDFNLTIIARYKQTIHFHNLH